MDEPGLALTPIGAVESPLTEPVLAPRQGDEGAPDAWLAFEPAVLEGLESLQPGDEILVLTWLHRARRDVLRVHPRGDTSRAQQGVFSTRSPDRPNPIGLHRVEIVSNRRRQDRGATPGSGGRHADPRREAAAHERHRRALAVPVRAVWPRRRVPAAC